MRVSVAGMLLMALLMQASYGGQNAGGVLVVHHDPELIYTATFTCDSLDVPSDCSELNTIAAADATPRLWFVLAAFSDSLENRLGTLVFGLGGYDDQCVVIGDWGPCSLIGTPLEIPGTGWPGPNSGTAVTWAPNYLGGQLVPVYWFVSYGYSPGSIPLGPDPVHGGEFVDSNQTADPILAYGKMGLGTSGFNTCPPQGQPLGACCDFEACFLVTESECAQLQGTWLGPVPCDPNPCHIESAVWILDARGDEPVVTTNEFDGPDGLAAQGRPFPLNTVELEKFTYVDRLSFHSVVKSLQVADDGAIISQSLLAHPLLASDVSRDVQLEGHSFNRDVSVWQSEERSYLTDRGGALIARLPYRILDPHFLQESDLLAAVAVLPHTDGTTYRIVVLGYDGKVSYNGYETTNALTHPALVESGKKVMFVEDRPGTQARTKILDLDSKTTTDLPELPAGYWRYYSPSGDYVAIKVKEVPGVQQIQYYDIRSTASPQLLWSADFNHVVTACISSNGNLVAIQHHPNDSVLITELRNRSGVVLRSFSHVGDQRTVYGVYLVPGGFLFQGIQPTNPSLMSLRTNEWVYLYDVAWAQ